MKIKEIAKILNAEVLYSTEELLNTEVNSACASDMMSDVLAYVKNQAVLITGLCNPQVVRTAEMMDMLCVVLVRGKKPDENMIRLANERGIAVLVTPLRMFATCGMLYSAGLKPED